MDIKNLDRSCKTYYVIAEIGNNHAGNIDVCKEMILEAKLSGANAVKLQMRDNHSLFTKKFYDSPYDNPNSYGSTYGEHREFVELTPQEMIIANEYSHSLGIDFICTAFDINSAGFIANSLNCDAYKLASSDLCNPTLLDYFNSLENKKPLILSSGGHSLEDIKWSFNYLCGYKEKITILHCVSAYPADHSLLNLNSIKAIQDIVSGMADVGYSSHDNGTTMPIIAATLGAKVIEKHFTLNRAAKGTDHPMSLNPTMMKNLVRDLKYLELCLGSPDKPVHEIEKKALRKMMKSPYYNKNFKIGEVITSQSIVEKIPFTGLTIRDFHENCLGKRLTQDVLLEDSVHLDHFDN